MRIQTELVAFDLDGTLVDSRRDLAESANLTLVECGAAPIDEAGITAMIGDGAAELVARAFRASGRPQPADALERFLAIYEERLLRHTRPYAGVNEALATLSAVLPLAVLSNKPLAATRAVLSGLDLFDYFTDGHVLGGDGPFPKKPDPTGLLHLARLVGAESASVTVVGDSAIDWHTARNAGARIIVARYGFGFPTLASVPLADVVGFVDSPAELVSLLMP